MQGLNCINVCYRPAVCLAAVCLVALLAAEASAQKRLLELTLNAVPASVTNPDTPPAQLPDYNLVRMQAVSNVSDADAPPGFPANTDVPWVVQKNGVAEPTYHGMSSDYTYLKGTMTAVVDFGGGAVPTRIQIVRSTLEFHDGGEYCPGDGSLDGEDKTLDQRGDPNPGQQQFRPEEECDASEGDEAAAFGLAIGQGQGLGGSVGAAVRYTLMNLNGASDVTGGTNLNAVNWHLFLDQVALATDGTGALDYTVAPELNFEAAHDMDYYPDQPIHNESDNGEINESTYFAGTLIETATANEYELNFPLYNPIYLTDETDSADPNNYHRIIHRTLDDNVETTLNTDKAFLRATGVLGDTLLEGDANRDGKVDGLDVNIISLHWKKGTGHTHVDGNNEPHTPNELIHAKWAVWDEGDVDLNTIIQRADLDIVVGNFGAMAGAGSGGTTGQVPEPSSLFLALLCSAAALCRRRVRRI